MLVEDKALVTLPVSTMVLGTLVATLPASFWMRYIGRRLGFMTGAAIGFVGGIAAAVAIYENVFWLFCVGTFLMGSYNAFGQYYRFAAADIASVDYRAKAISYVMAGGVVSALLGPRLALHTHDLIPGQIYLASYLSLSILATAALVLLSFIRIPRMTAEERRETRPALDGDRAPARVRRGRAQRGGRLRDDEPGDDGDAAGDGALRPRHGRHPRRDPVARAGHVRALVRDRASDPPLRRPQHRRRRLRDRVAGGADRPSRRHPGPLLRRTAAPGSRLEFHVRRRHHAGHRGLRAGRAGQDPGPQRLSRLRVGRPLRPSCRGISFISSAGRRSITARSPSSRWRSRRSCGSPCAAAPNRRPYRRDTGNRREASGTN